MGNPIGHRARHGTKRESHFVAANAAALAALVALLLVFLALWTSTPASAGDVHIYNNRATSADCVELSGCQIRYTSSSRYGDAVAHADGAWSPVGRVVIAPDGPNQVNDLRISDVTGDCAGDYVGRTTLYGDAGIDTIVFNVCNFNQFDYPPFARQGTATHEFGHALGLTHSQGVNMPIPNIMHTPSRATERNTPYTHDKSDYRIRW